MSPDYPLRIEGKLDPTTSRWLWIIKWLLVLPHAAFSGKYPRGLFDLLMGLNRWVYRVWAYMMLMTDEYPPFRLDRGGDDPTTPQDSPGVPFSQVSFEPRD